MKSSPLNLKQPENRTKRRTFYQESKNLLLKPSSPAISESLQLENAFPATIFGPHDLVELVRYRAQVQPNDSAFVYLANGIDEEIHLSNRELDRQARIIGAWLQSRKMYGERILLLYPPGLEFITAFFGCLYAGSIAVPIYPPRRNRSMLRIQSIADSAKAKVALATSGVLKRVEEMIDDTPHLKQLSWQATDTLSREFADQWRLPKINSDTIAFLQYTSGSTGTPKGVVLSHGNLIHNSRLINISFEHTRTGSGVFWLPSYHDMGLIGGILQPLFCGCPNILMSPLTFLQKPVRWLNAISKYRASTSGGPNFAYDFCIRQVKEEEIDQLDLSCWDIAFNGAEPVQAETLEKFAERFERCGFNYKAFYPCFGLAEATLLVSGGYKSLPPIVRCIDTDQLAHGIAVDTTPGGDRAKRFVSSGRNMIDQRIAIVDPETSLERGEGEIGEIWVRGPSIAKGYWNNPEATEYTFRARIADTKEGPFMRTGDLGFMGDGELYVTGRIKDLIIIRGVNVYPQDIEATVQKVDSNLRSGCGGAFMMNDGTVDRLVIVQELERRFKGETEPIFNAVRKAVAIEHEIPVDAIVLVKAGSIPKTSSGKIQRHACRQGFAEGALNEIDRWTVPGSKLKLLVPPPINGNGRKKRDMTDFDEAVGRVLDEGEKSTFMKVLSGQSAKSFEAIQDEKDGIERIQPQETIGETIRKEQEQMNSVQETAVLEPENREVPVTISFTKIEEEINLEIPEKTEPEKVDSAPVFTSGSLSFDEVAEAVLEEVKKVGKDRAVNLSVDTDITELGLDSLERMEILASLEDRFGGQFPESILPELFTAKEVIEAVRKYLGNGPRQSVMEDGPVLNVSEIPESAYDIAKFPEVVKMHDNLEMIRAMNLNHFFDVHEGITRDKTIIGGKEYINFSSYNYIDTSGDPEVTKAAQEACERYGTSVSASRLVSGEKPIHRELENGITNFLGTEDTIVMVSGHATNETVIGHMLSASDMILHDALAHNSIVQGAILSGARRRPFPHNDWEAADWILKKHRGEYRRVMIVVEGVYSMDGDYPDLPALIELKKRHKTLLMVDEAHSLGVLGKTGRGIGEHFEVNRADVDLWMCTLSKTFASCGGYISGSKALVEYLKYTAPGFVFSVGIPAQNTAAALAALRILEREPERVERLRKNSEYFLNYAKEKGLNTGLSKDSAVVPAIIGNSVLCLKLSRALFDAGINVQPILHPAVEEKAARMRFFITSAHTEEEIRFTIDTLARLLAELES